MDKWIAGAMLVLLPALALYAQKLERVNPDGLVKPTAYTQVVRAGKLIFIAGQVGNLADGRIAGVTMKEQAEQTLNNLEAALKSQGADFSHVAKITTYVTSMSDYQAPEVRDLRSRYFGDHLPASTLVQVVQLANPVYKIEIEAIAVLP